MEHTLGEVATDGGPIDPGRQIEALGREVYGDRYEEFLSTPRRSLGLETPRALLDRGDHEPVLMLLIKGLHGDFL